MRGRVFMRDLFPKKLKQLRKEHGHTQEELAKKLAITRQTVSNWENGRSFPDHENVYRLAKLYGQTLSIFLPDLPEAPMEAEEISSERIQLIRFFICLLVVLSFLIPFVSVITLFLFNMWKKYIHSHFLRLCYPLIYFLALCNCLGVLLLFYFQLL
ncbi:helix-turn-helix transcriptional regulator [Enterococcus faecium]|uniref:helix-turn-helix transcriptional regulator n=1 Tax=Enterococcus faecium TaxID=1352 RepID=UPI002889D75B|nr:helix-turn-helix transcriptional regulator [Enterococcus faecium]